MMFPSVLEVGLVRLCVYDPGFPKVLYFSHLNS